MLDEAETYHANAGGLIGGYAACDAKDGIVVCDEDRVNCDACRKLIEEYYARRRRQAENR